MTKGYNQQKDSAFNKKVRIKSAQLEWIRKVKGRYTLAGKLDEIINFFRHHNDHAGRKET